MEVDATREYVSIDANPCFRILGPKSKNPGTILLYCSLWRKEDAAGKRMCWFSRPFPREGFAELGQLHRDKYQDLQLALRRNSVR